MAGAGIAWPPAALAHGDLVSSFPEANSVLSESPAALALTFSEAIDPRTATAQVADEAGLLVTLGAPALDPARTTIRWTLPHLEPGLYSVQYQATSALDGHASRGGFVFLVDPTGTRAPPGSSPATTPPPDLRISLARWLALALGLGLVGTALFWLVSVRTGGAAPGPPWALLAAMGWGSLAGLAWYLAESAAAVGGAEGPGLDLAAPFGATPFADAMRAVEVTGLLAALAATVGLVRSARRAGSVPSESGRGVLVVVAVAGVAALGGWAAASHAAAIGGPSFAVLDWLHLLAAAAWLGALPGVLSLLARDRSAAVSALRRHSRLAMAAAPVLLASGLANSSLVIGEARNLVATDYGNQLVAKALLFSAALALGAANFFLVRAGSWRRLARVGIAELSVGAGAVMIAALLSTGQPAAARLPVVVAPAGGATQIAADAGGSRIQLAVIVAAPGAQRYQLSIRDRATGAYRTDVSGIALLFEPPPGAGMAPLRLALRPTELPWLWTAAGEYTPVPGEWRIRVSVDRSSVTEASAALALVVGEAAGGTVVPPPTTGLQVPGSVLAAWSALPRGPLGWMPAVVALLILLALLAAERGRPGATGAPVIRIAVAVLAVGLGMLAGTRDLVTVTDVAPPEAMQRINPEPDGEASVEDGRRLYRANCAACHQPDAGDLASIIGRATDGALEWRIAVGTAATRMPGFASTLSTHDRWNLVNFLRSLTRD